MLKEHSDRICSWFAVHFDAEFRLMRKIGEAADVIQDRLKVPRWGAGKGQFVFRDSDRMVLLVLENGAFRIQTLGLDAWTKNLADYSGAICDALGCLGVQTTKRVGFQTQAYLPIKMSYAEAAELMHGSFVVNKEQLSPLGCTVNDSLLLLNGTRNGMQLELVVTPSSAEQSAIRFMATPNLESFLESKLLDTSIKDFRDRIADDCLYVQVDLGRERVQRADITRFAQEVLNEDDALTTAVVGHLKSLFKRGM